MFAIKHSFSCSNCMSKFKFNYSNYTQGQIHLKHSSLDNTTLKISFLLLVRFLFFICKLLLVVDEEILGEKLETFMIYLSLQFVSLNSILLCSSVDTHHYSMSLIHWDDHKWCERLKIDLLVCLYQDDLH